MSVHEAVGNLTQEGVIDDNVDLTETNSIKNRPSNRKKGKDRECGPVSAELERQLTS
jgi:hypothetical protein